VRLGQHFVDWEFAGAILAAEIDQQGMYGKRGPLIHVSNHGGPINVVPVLLLMLGAILLVILFKGPKPPRG